MSLLRTMVTTSKRKRTASQDSASRIGSNHDDSTSLLPSKLVSEIAIPSVKSPRSLDQRLSTHKTERLDDGKTIQELWQTVDRELRENIGASVRCGICLSTVQDAVMTLCVHSFCSGCLDRVLSQQREPKCPECQQRITRRSCQPYEMMNEMGKLYKEALKDFGLCPSIADPTFTTLTQAAHDSSSDEEDEGNEIWTKHIERSQVSKAWQKSFEQGGGKVKPIFISENARVVESNERSIKNAKERKRLVSQRCALGSTANSRFPPSPLNSNVASIPSKRPPSGMPTQTQGTIVAKSGESRIGSILRSTSPPGAGVFPSTQEIIDQAQEQQAADRSAEWLEEDEKEPDDARESSFLLFSGANDPAQSPTPTFATARENESQESGTTEQNQFSYGSREGNESSLKATFAGTSEKAISRQLSCDGERAKENISGTEEFATNDVVLDGNMCTMFPHNSKTQTFKRLQRDDGGEPVASLKNHSSLDDSSNGIGRRATARQQDIAEENDSNCTTWNSAKRPKKRRGRTACNPESSSLLDVGTIVDVQPRTWVGINKPGGVARVTKIHEDGSYDVAYVLGGRECNVDAVFVNPQGEGKRPRRRKNSRASEEAVASSWRNELPSDLLAALANEGFDTGIRPTKNRRKQESSGEIRHQSLDSSRGVTSQASKSNKGPGIISGRHSTPAKKMRRQPFQNAFNRTELRTSGADKHNSEAKGVKQSRMVEKVSPSQSQNIALEAQVETPLQEPCGQQLCQLADVRYSVLMQQAIDEGFLHVVASNLTESDMDVLQGFCRKTLRQLARKGQEPVKMKLTESFGKKTNLCVAYVETRRNDKGVLTARSRTLKSMRAALAGIPIVSPSYIYACQEADKVLLPQSSMMIRSLPSKTKSIESSCASTYGVAALAVRAHESTGDDLLLSRKAVLLCGSIAPAKRNDIQLLLKEAGAELLSNPTVAVTKLKDMIDQPALEKRTETVVLLCDDTNCNTSINVIPVGLYKQAKLAAEHNRRVLLVVNSSWLFDSISCGSVLGAEEFEPASPKARELWSLVAK